MKLCPSRKPSTRFLRRDTVELIVQAVVTNQDIAKGTNAIMGSLNVKDNNLAEQKELFTQLVDTQKELRTKAENEILAVKGVLTCHGVYEKFSYNIYLEIQRAGIMKVPTKPKKRLDTNEITPVIRKAIQAAFPQYE